MNNFAIQVERLGKRYRVGGQERYKSLRDVLTNRVKAPFRSLRPSRKNRNGSNATATTDFQDQHSRRRNGNGFVWALDDVSFQIKPGEVVGIIGRNGAGKSTLLRVLSRITRPTRGSAQIRGRVGALLEVGTGFHPELTGRDNIYLSGAVLGMRSTEIKSKFDEIVAFAEVERFIDTPVKRYSSGMQVRLAFAVAAHLEPEILLIDEVLAVGDADFQKRCLGRMGDVAHQGRTVVLVSHNMASVARLCPRAILLEHGLIKEMGKTADVVATYLHSGFASQSERYWSNLAHSPGNDLVRLNLVRMRDESGSTKQVFDSREPVGLEVGYTVLQDAGDLAAEFVIYDDKDNLLFTSANQYDDELYRLHRAGSYLSTCWIPGNLMTEGTFCVRLSIEQIQVPVKVHVYESEILAFQVVDSMEGDSARGRIAHHYPGVIRPKLEWHTRFLSNDTSGSRQTFDLDFSAQTAVN